MSALHEAVREAPGLAPATRDRYLRDLNHWTAFAGADPAGWTPAQVDAFLADLSTRMAPASVVRMRATLGFASRWWALRGGQSFEGAPLEMLSSMDVRGLLAACGADPGGWRDAALIVLGLETGLRWDALAALELEDLAPPWRSAWSTPPSLRITNRGGELVLPLSPTAARALQPWVGWLGLSRGPLFRPIVRFDQPGGGDAYLAQRRALSPSGIQKALDARARLAGLPRVRSLRTTFLAWRAAVGYTAAELAVFDDHEANLEATPELLARLAASTPPWLAALVAGRSV